MIDVEIRELYSFYLCPAKHLVTELSIFWLCNVIIIISVYPVKFS